MSNKYIDLINKTFDFPQKEFSVIDNRLFFHDIDLINLVKEYGTPLKFTYLPKISENILLAKKWFYNAFKKYNYPGKYYYAYCTKSSHFKFIIDEALRNDIHIETSSAYDIPIIEKLYDEGKINKNTMIICNGFKSDEYIANITKLINNGFKNCIPVLDNFDELDFLSQKTNNNFDIGIRIATEEKPKFEFYTSRLGIKYDNIIDFYNKKIKLNKNVKLKMLHFFVNTGIKDNSYYWNELNKCINTYIELKKECKTLNILNIGGGFPIKNSLDFKYNYQDIVDKIIYYINKACINNNITPPDIVTEFGSFTVGEASGAIYKVLYQKQQNDREKWNLIDSSFITTLPDSWAINKKFIMLPINKWSDKYEKVLLGGLTCDSDDYYNSEQNSDEIYLPKYNKSEPLYIGFFNTGAYQETIGGFGGLQHCLIPTPKHLIISKNKNGELNYTVFKQKQSAKEFLDILGYNSYK